jgi:hypothetical protein
MKIKSLIAGLLLSAITANASVAISGTSLFNTEMNGYSTGVYVVSDSGSFDTNIVLDPWGVGVPFTQGTNINGYTILGTGSVHAVGPASVLLGGITYNLDGSVATGNEIAVLVFKNATTETVAFETLQIYTNDWLVPADGANNYLTGAGPYTGSYVAEAVWFPEPSSYALLGGLLALTCVMLRRRA